MTRAAICDGIALLRDQVREAAGALALDFLLRERRIQRDVRDEVQRPRKLRRQRRHRNLHLVHRRGRGERRSQPRHFVGDLQRVARLRALVQHRGGEIRQARHVRRVGAAAAREHQARRDDRQLAALAEDDLQAVGQRELLGRRILRRSDRARLGHSFRHGSSTFTLWRAAGRRCLRSRRIRPPASSRRGWRTARRARAAEDTARERLDRLRAGGAIALDVLPQVVRRSQVVLVAVQPIGLAAEPAERFEPGDDPCLDGVPGAFELAGVGPGCRRSGGAPR